MTGTAQIVWESIALIVREKGIANIPVNGRSMLPFIVGGEDWVLLKRPETLKVGDVVFADTKEKGYVIHRIDSIAADGTYALLGDGNLGFREHCQLADIKAIAVEVIKPDGRHKPLGYGFRAKMWRRLLPIRRYLLWIYFRFAN